MEACDAAMGESTWHHMDKEQSQMNHHEAALVLIAVS